MKDKDKLLTTYLYFSLTHLTLNYSLCYLILDDLMDKLIT